MCKRLFLIASILFLAISSQAQILSEQSKISLLTCTPGRPLYLHFGHAALRVEDPVFIGVDSIVGPIDWTFNYGIFSFSTDHFYWKFLRGETDYQLGLQATQHFILSSHLEGREVFEQELRLSREERQNVFDALVENYKPENRVYRYNFVFDNCATRPMRLIENALPDFKVSDDTIADSWRKQVSYYAGKWSWGEFGINLIFGRQADRKMTLAESLFLPENLMNYMETTDLVGEHSIGVFTPRDTSFWTSPQLVILLIVLLFGLLIILEIKHKTLCFAVDVTLYTIYTIIGLIIGFLMFFSVHPLVRENANFLIFNPFCIILLVLCCTSKGKKWIADKGFILTGYVLVGAVLTTVVWQQTFHLLWLLPIIQTARYVILKFINQKHNHAK